MEPSPRDVPCRSPHSSGRFRRGARIAEVAWKLARGEGALSGLGLMVAVLAVLLWVVAARSGVVLRLVVFFPLSFACVLLAVALSFVAAEALAGRSCGIGEAVAAARARSRSVAAFALVGGLVALALGALVRTDTAATGWPVLVLGLAWGLATLFSAPEVALQGSGGIAAIRRSLSSLRRCWLEALAGVLAIGVFGLLALAVPSALIALDAPVGALVGYLAWGTVFALLLASWGAFTVVFQRYAAGAVAAELPAPPLVPFWRNPLQRRAWIAWSTAIVVTVVLVGAVLMAQRQDPRHKYDVEQPALAAPNVIPFPLANRDQIHEGTGIYWFREAAGTVRRIWVRSDVLLVEVLLEPRFIPRAEDGGFQVNEEDGSVWISIVPTGLT